MAGFTSLVKRSWEMFNTAGTSRDHNDEPVDKAMADAIAEFQYTKNARKLDRDKAFIYRVEVEEAKNETKEGDNKSNEGENKSKEGKNESKKQKLHTIVHIPKYFSRVDMLDKAFNYSEMNEYLEKARKGDLEWTYNICMFDTSGSMREYWYPFVRNWNHHMRHRLDGSVDLYTFDSDVRYIHDNPELQTGYFSGYGTHLSRALTKLAHLVRGCPHKHVRIFLVTDGRDSDRDKDPLNALRTYCTPKDKRIDVYILGIGNNFPVDISLSLRSQLHTGPANTPTLFWAKYPKDIDGQLDAMRDAVTPAMFIRLNKPALVLPSLTETKEIAYPGDYLYFEEDPDVLTKTLVMVLEDIPKVKYDKDWKRNVDRYRYSRDYHEHYDYDRGAGMHFDMMMMMDRRFRRRHMYDDYDMSFPDDMDESMIEEMCYRHGIDPDRFRKKKEAKRETAVGERALLPCCISRFHLDPRTLLDKIFKQWASILLQRSKTNKKIDASVYDFMEKLFTHYAEKEAMEKALYKDQSIKARLERKSKVTLITEFKEFLKDSKETTDLKTKFGDEIKLAKAVLKTTVSTKYDDQALKTKGYGGSAEWNTDMGKFMDEYAKIKDQILALTTPIPEDSCRVYLSSFLADLQDSSNFETLVRGGKLTFLQEMTFCGVPVLSPVKDSTQMNPWTIQIRNVVNSPYEILCQRVLEDSMPRIHFFRDAKDKSIYLKENDKRFKFNIIIPVIPREYTELLKPLMTSTVYAVACSYCILKNANILDRNCHLAALGCIWMRCVREFPLNKRPEYIRNRILNIEANAKVYLPRKTIATYIDCLLTLPYRALQTEAEATFKDVKIKCESILKPCFLLQLIKDDVALIKKHQANFPKLLQYVLLEFLGRCVSSYKSDTPFIDFFLPAVDTAERDGWIQSKCDNIFCNLEVSGTELFKKYPDLNGVKKYIKTCVKKNLKDLEKDLSWRDLIGDDPLDWREDATGTRRRVIRYESDEDIFASFYSRSSDDEDDDTPRAYDTEDMETEREPGDDFYDAPKLKILMPNFAKINKLRHSGSAGQIDWSDLKAWAHEMLANLGADALPHDDPPGAVGGGPPRPDAPPADPSQTPMAVDPPPPEERPVCLIQEDVDLAFSLDNVTLYLYHALTHRSSSSRLLEPMVSPQEAKHRVDETITTEWKRVLNTELVPKLEKMVRDAWVNAYREAHNNLARPLTRQQIITMTAQRGIDVNEQNFDQVYRYRASTGLCRNACQVEQCPHFLTPNRHMNAHLEVERQELSYPHTLHLVVSRNIADVEGSASAIVTSRLGGSHKRQKKFVGGGSEPVRKYVEQLKGVYKDFNGGT